MGHPSEFVAEFALAGSQLRFGVILPCKREKRLAILDGEPEHRFSLFSVCA